MSERRIVWLLLFVVLGQLILLAGQVPAEDGEQSQLAAGALWLVGPVAGLVAGSVAFLNESAETLQDRGALIADNRRLREENRDLRQQLQSFGDMEVQLRRMATAVSYSAPRGTRPIAADIVYADYASWVRTLLIFVPAPEVQLNQAVVAPDGLVGRIIVRSGEFAKVQLITDRAAGVGATLTGVRRQGLVRGTDSGELEMVYVPQQAQVQVGERVVTSGIDGVFPRGLEIGTVVDVQTTAGDLFHEIRVQPAVDLQSLDQVYVLTWARIPDALLEPPQ